MYDSGGTVLNSKVDELCHVCADATVITLCVKHTTTLYVGCTCICKDLVHACGALGLVCRGLFISSRRSSPARRNGETCRATVVAEPNGRLACCECRCCIRSSDLTIGVGGAATTTIAAIATVDATTHAVQ